MSVTVVSGAPDEFIEWAKKATAGLDQSNIMLGLWKQNDDKTVRWEFKLQIGHCLTEGKPLIIVAEQNEVIPPKLIAAATVVEYYVGNNEHSMQAALLRALEKIGITPTH